MPAGELRSETQQAYADALKVVWAVMCGVSALGLVATFFTEEFSLDGPGKMHHNSEQDASTEESEK